MDFLYVSMEEMQRKAMLYLNFHNVFLQSFFIYLNSGFVTRKIAC